jgi:hypothetical protein
MLAHWNIKAALRGQPPPFTAAQLGSIMAEAGERGRELGRAENEVRPAANRAGRFAHRRCPCPPPLLDRPTQT